MECIPKLPFRFIGRGLATKHAQCEVWEKKQKVSILNKLEGCPRTSRVSVIVTFDLPEGNSYGTSTPTGEQLLVCQITFILKSKHKYRSYGLDNSGRMDAPT